MEKMYYVNGRYYNYNDEAYEYLDCYVDSRDDAETLITKTHAIDVVITPIYGDRLDIKDKCNAISSFADTVKQEVSTGMYYYEKYRTISSMYNELISFYKRTGGKNI